MERSSVRSGFPLAYFADVGNDSWGMAAVFRVIPDALQARAGIQTLNLRQLLMLP